MNNDKLQKFMYIVKRVSLLFNEKMLGSILLLLSTIIAFIWANTIYFESYYALWNISVTVGIGSLIISDTLGHLINDGLMSIFFFLIGLEIKRELLIGELSSVQKAALPAFAALGGMLFPAAFYLLFNWGEPGSIGWGIPMATDIAFTLGVLIILGSIVPISLKVFLLALAIFDDMGAILVIALYYTDQISLLSLGAGILIMLLSIFLNAKGVRRTYAYALLGLALWLAFLFSGVHATIAGVLLAFTIPARSLHDRETFKKATNSIIQEFPEKDFRIMLVDTNQRNMMKRLQGTVDDLDTPLQKLEETLYPIVYYFIIPIFALANAGVNVAEGSGETSLINHISTGIIAGLFIGKQLGITLSSWLAVKLGLAQMPDGVDWKHIWALSCLAGIGFTMSLFITNLAFVDPIALFQAKIAILIGSSLSAIMGISIFLGNRKRNTDGT
ncbi:MAG: Na+/H+ antiporter NhaA [Syntrophomonadaceae bacterium]|jgi:NhaA family Na+:H+ antiporter